MYTNKSKETQTYIGEEAKILIWVGWVRTQILCWEGAIKMLNGCWEGEAYIGLGAGSGADFDLPDLTKTLDVWVV